MFSSLQPCKAQGSPYSKMRKGKAAELIGENEESCKLLQLRRLAGTKIGSVHGRVLWHVSYQPILPTFLTQHLLPKLTWLAIENQLQGRGMGQPCIAL